MELQRVSRDNKPGHLLSFTKHASFLLRDGLKIARLAFVDVSAAELMTEDATNAEEWGPTTTTMASISEAARTFDEYERIVQVLRGRFSLTAKKHWRQVYKAFTVLEYLLTHGPDQLIMEFREDKARIDEFTRFVYVDENLVDRGSALQKKAKQVQKLLTDEKFYVEERRRAQKISKGILGFGSQTTGNNSKPQLVLPNSSPPNGAEEGLDDPNPLKNNTSGAQVCKRQVDFRKSKTHPGTYSYTADITTNAFRESGPGAAPSQQGEDVSPVSQRSESSWNVFPISYSLASDSPNMSSTSTDWNPFDESPTSCADSFTCNSNYSSGSPIAGGWAASPKRSMSSPLPRKKIIEELETSSTASSRVSLIPLNKVLLKPAVDVTIPANFVASKLPPPPPGGSKVGGYFVSRGLKPAELVVPDLLEFRSGLNPVLQDISAN